MIAAAPTAFDWTQTGILGAIVLAVVWSGFKRKWVWGWEHDEIRRDRDEWKELALRLAGVAETAVERTARVIHTEVRGIQDGRDVP